MNDLIELFPVSLIELIAIRNALEGYVEVFLDDDLYSPQVEVIETVLKRIETRIKSHQETS